MVYADIGIIRGKQLLLYQGGNIMKMHEIAKRVTRCEKCGNTFNTRNFLIIKGSENVCLYCCKRELEDRRLDELKVNCHEMFKMIDENDCLEERFFSERIEFFGKTSMHKKLTPKEIVRFLDRNVIGQENAKRVLAVAVSTHYKRIGRSLGSATIPKSNILMQGATGSGKTYLLQNLAKYLDVPFYIADVSRITEAGYKGDDIECILTGLYQAADGDIQKAEKGIVFLDEFDKLSSRYGHGSDGSSVGEGVQRQILKMIEGCTMEIQKRGNRKQGETVTIDTNNILFICGGAFVGIKDKDKTVKENVRTVGFEMTRKEQPAVQQINEKQRLTTSDFVKYGLIPEVVGRLPIIVELDTLTEADFVKILSDSEDSLIKGYQVLMDEYDVELIFEEEALKEIAQQAMERKTGARGLNAIVEGVMRDILFEVPSNDRIKRCTITRKTVLGEEAPKLEYREDRGKLYDLHNWGYACGF